MGITEDIELQERLIEYEAEEPKVLTPSVQYEVVYKDTTLTILPKQWRNSFIIKGQILLCFYLFIVIGIADQTVGTLLPTLINHYQTSQTVITILFILQFLGYSTSALSNEKLHRLLGRRGVIVSGTLFLSLSLLTNSTMPYLPIYILMHFSYGLGVGLMDSCMNVLLSSLEDHNELMGLLHGFYGFGSILGPPMVSHILEFTATSKESNDGSFGLHYFILFCMATLGIFSALWLFRYESKLKYEYEINEHSAQEEEDQSEDNDQFEDVEFAQLMKNKLILLFASYLFFYVGAEISVGSWLLSYLITIKNLQQLEASYIVSWFWIGLTIGRMLLGFVTKRFKNEYRANLCYSLVSLSMFSIYSLFTTLVSDNFADANWFIKGVNVFLIMTAGIFIGPLFPTANVCLMKILPPKLHVSGVGIATSIGGTGSAVITFLVGYFVELTSFKMFPFYIIIVISSYCLTWFLVPRLTKSMVKYDY